jgi:branched-chain amino acid transport system substrate-binding protein
MNAGRTIMHRRTLLTSAAALTAAAATGRRAAAADVPGVTATEIKIGQTEAYSGPASSYGAIGRGLTAFFKRLNDDGGVGGRMINFISVDDGYSPPKTVEQTRRLVEEDEVSFILNSLGTPTSSAVQRYLNSKKVPQLFVASGANKWGDPQHFPWTMGWQPSYRTEAQIYAKYILSEKPDGKIAVLYQNDDFGKDYVAGLKDVLGDKFSTMVVSSVSYEVTDPTIDSQAVTLQGTGADVLLTAATPKFAAQMIRKVADLGWKPLHLMTNVSISVATVIRPAGADKAVGMISAGYLKDSSDARWKDDAGMNEWRAFMAKYMSGSDLADGNYAYAYSVGQTVLQVLKQCGADASRANIMKQAASLTDLTCATLLPGIIVNTSATNFHPIRQMQLQRWGGTQWNLFGKVIEGSNV